MSDQQRIEELDIGTKLIVLAREGKEKDGEKTVIGRLADGRAIVFAKGSPMKITPGDTVMGEIVYVKRNYVIINPETVLGDTMEALIENLKNVGSSGYYQHAVLAKALLWMIKKELEKLE